RRGVSCFVENFFGEPSFDPEPAATGQTHRDRGCCAVAAGSGLNEPCRLQRWFSTKQVVSPVRTACHLLPALLLAMAPLLRADSPDDNRNAFFTAFLADEFKQRPVEATRLGDHRFDNQMDDLSRKARAHWLERHRTAAAELPRRVEAAKLTRSGQID